MLGEARQELTSMAVIMSKPDPCQLQQHSTRTIFSKYLFSRFQIFSTARGVHRLPLCFKVIRHAVNAKRGVK